MRATHCIKATSDEDVVKVCVLVPGFCYFIFTVFILYIFSLYLSGMYIYVYFMLTFAKDCTFLAAHELATQLDSFTDNAISTHR